MIGLYLLAAHLVGDFVLQTRWQAIGKYQDARLRAHHVSTYCLPFLLVLAVTQPGWYDALLFLGALWGYHFVTDSRRFLSNLGDRIAWRLGWPQNYDAEGFADWKLRPLEPNPWPPLPILIDQALHVVQLAVLGGIFLQ